MKDAAMSPRIASLIWICFLFASIGGSQEKETEVHATFQSLYVAKGTITALPPYNKEETYNLFKRNIPIESAGQNPEIRGCGRKAGWL